MPQKIYGDQLNENFACESSVNWCSLYLDSGLPGSTFTQSTHSACTHIYSFTFWTEESY